MTALGRTVSPGEPLQRLRKSVSDNLGVSWWLPQASRGLESKATIAAALASQQGLAEASSLGIRHSSYSSPRKEWERGHRMPQGKGLSPSVLSRHPSAEEEQCDVEDPPERGR